MLHLDFERALQFAAGVHAELADLPAQRLRERLPALVTKYFFEGHDYWQSSGCPAWLAEQCGQQDR